MLTEGTGELETGEFEDLVCGMLQPVVFVEELENLKEDSSSVLYLLKVKNMCEALLKKNEKLRSVSEKLVKLGEWER